MSVPAEEAATHSASAELPLLRLKRGEDRRLRAGHLWVFSNEVDNEATPLTEIATGGLARVVSDRELFLGYAYVNPHALICARIISRSPVHPPDRSLIEHRLKVALALRERLYAVPYYRLIFGESDGLPGLVLDRYGDTIVGQIATAGMEALRPQVESAVVNVLGVRTLVWKNDGAARELESLPRQVLTPVGRAPDTLTILENGLPFSVVLRPERQSRAVAAADVSGGARAGRVQLRRRLGHSSPDAWSARGAVHRRLGRRAQRRGTQRRRQQRRTEHAARGCFRSHG
jgi:23S rRNA (cytosine1962-C5)-methyltransferase